MNSRTIDPRTLGAVLAMEAGLILPLISLPTQGDRVPGLLGPLLLVLMLPIGYLAVHHVLELRDPSWRLLCGICIALVTRAVVSSVPEPGVPGLMIWLGHSFVPAAIGIALFWRGGSLDAAEMTAADVRREFNVLALGMLAELAVARPFLLADPVLLGGSVALFAGGGLLATALARQDAAEAASPRLARTLAITMALVPAGAAVLLVSVLRPGLLGSVWSTLGQAILLVLTPIGWLLNWLVSLLPKGTPAQQGPLPPPPPRPVPDLSKLGQMPERPDWVGEAIVVVLLLAASILIVLLVRLMLSNWIKPPPRPAAERGPEVTVERSGTPGQDAQALLGWVLRWLRSRFRPARGVGIGRGVALGAANAEDAVAAYRRLLEWAEQRDLARRPAETTGQLQTRLASQVPESAEAVGLVTITYERERYGALHPPPDRLRRVQAALRTLLDR